MNDIELALLIDRFMRRIHFALQAKATDFDRENVGPGGGIVLLTLADMGCVGLGELTNRVARDKSQMTRTIRALESKGLVQRQPSPRDARVTLISLTGRGEATVGAIKEALAETINEILEPITQSDKEKLKQLLQNVAP